ncbi:hypothetical protein K2173_021150 [Erythroxylum novogranatense]|uniref:Uncharacterized protein n=1 Tax=Erythroxylum novogranatense TaxID=1862640 RepID=A0AAV8TQD9_9ROSI|nr:hypothetical protein K2173_021150 [Erythroxylum novogranatense]
MLVDDSSFKFLLIVSIPQDGKICNTVSDAVDDKGFPADKSRTGGWVPAALILGIEIVERLSTMGIAVNLVTYLIGVMHLPSATSANRVTDFMGTSFLLYKTIAIFTVIQVLGTGMLATITKLPQLRPPPCHTSKSCIQADGTQLGILYAALYLIALGTGGLKSSVSGFGTDQFDERQTRRRSLKWLISSTDEVGRSWAYGICTAFMVIAVVTFLSGTKRYRYKKSMGSPIVHILQVVVAAWRKRKMHVPYDVSLFVLDKAAIVAQGDLDNNGSVANPWKLCSVTRVEEVKMMVRLLPIWATTILFWTTYAQLITFSVEQASTMSRSIRKLQIPAGSLTVFFVAAILITLAVYDRFIMPFWKKWKDNTIIYVATGFSSLQRIAIGLVLSTFGMVAAAISERKRWTVAKEVAGNSATTTLPLNAFFIQLDFFITQSPKSMKTISTGLFLTTLSMGFFVSSFLVMVVKKVTGTKVGHGWLADNIDNGRLDYFYGLLAVLGVINFIVYLICAYWYKPRNAKPSVEMETIVNESSAERNC